MPTKAWRLANADKVRKSRRDWYQRNSKHASGKVVERRRRLREWLRTQKLKCTKCPESHPACLEFHHRDRAAKEITLNKALSQGWGIKRMEAEIAKCDVLCANCHRKEHWPRASAGESVSKTDLAGSTPDVVAKNGV